MKKQTRRQMADIMLGVFGAMVYLMAIAFVSHIDEVQYHDMEVVK